MVCVYANHQESVYAERIKIGLFNIRSYFFPRGNSGIKSNGAKQ
nr:MAG TPA: hypothetical protein [Caudoviricetes sp.]